MLPESKSLNDPFTPILSGGYSVTAGHAHAMCTHVGIRYKHLNQDYMLASSFPVSVSEKIWCFGVFDGHGKGGEYASKETADTLTRFIRENIPKHPELAQPEPVSEDDWAKLMQKFIHDGIMAAHYSIIQMYETLTVYEDYSGVVYKKEPGAEGQTEWMSAKRNDLNDFGTTAAVALVRVTNGKPTQIVVGNTGDSYAYLLSEKLKCETLTTFIHGPKNAQEVARVSDKMVLDGIYFGVKPSLSPHYYHYGLAMTRAIGHHYSSCFGIIPDPTTYAYDIVFSNQYLVLASDGVSDVVTEQELVQFVTDCFKKKGISLGDVAQLIVKYSLEKWLIKYPHPKIPAEITDNTSVIIIDLNKLQ